jgi:hypothetical protein
MAGTLGELLFLGAALEYKRCVKGFLNADTRAALRRRMAENMMKTKE